MIDSDSMSAPTCDPNGIAPNQPEVHSQLTALLFQGSRSIHELENGFDFESAADTSIIPSLAEIIANERFCGPVPKFTLEVEEKNQSTKLNLTGPQGAKESLRAALCDLPAMQTSI
jgi:hypothetical protein